MRLFFVLLVFITMSFIGKSQDVKINCIIFIDGKLPYGSGLKGELVVSRHDEVSDTIKFNYQIGEIRVSEDEWAELVDLQADQPIRMNLRYLPFVGNAKFYSGNLRFIDLRSGYLIVRITNLKKKKKRKEGMKEYYFGISTSRLSSIFIEEEYYIFEEFPKN